MSCHRCTKALCLVEQSLTVLLQLYLDYCLFIEDLLREASIKAKQNGESKITARHVEKVTEVSSQARKWTWGQVLTVLEYAEKVQGINGSTAKDESCMEEQLHNTY